eukprot:6809929-Prorocentrum_lima.AAC.1
MDGAIDELQEKARCVIQSRNETAEKEKVLALMDKLKEASVEEETGPAPVLIEGTAEDHPAWFSTCKPGAA